MANVGETVAKYVGHKVSKVRWIPQVQGQLNPSETFVTGGWDDQINKLSIWKVEEPIGDSAAAFNVTNEPKLLCETNYTGDVTDIECIDSGRILVSSSTGSVSLFHYSSKHQSIRLEHEWSTLHHIGSRGCSCTCLSTNSSSAEVVSAGEDGQINVLQLDQRHPVRTIDSADSTTINNITFTKSHEVAAVTFGGQLKVWDLRQPSDKPGRTMLLSGDRVSLLCVDKHPTQPHLLAAGGQDGVLSIWDMRQELYPVTLLEAHAAEIWEVRFHPLSPDNLFTCSEDGSLWHWDGASVAVQSTTGYPGASKSHFSGFSNGAGVGGGYDNISPWLSVDATKHRMETFSLLPYNRLSINSLDIQSRHLLSGSDCEAILLSKILS
ncbi:Nucleoporin Nup43 [Desmophyllum pertusum]|uniref:Nucleoporin Nup43 n=1 Tax=Desmophyllum pertusum TaxID=174260 RepID=A0A9X0A6L5_9CNID|nr:Nucleoporin Nup43 [Desmophyllum pertusum]